LPAKFNTAFPGQHPIEDQEWKGFRGQRGFGFFGATNSRHFVTALGNEPLQIAAAAGMIFDKQNFHLGEAKTDAGAGPHRAPGATSLRRSESCLCLSRITAKIADYVRKRRLVKIRFPESLWPFRDRSMPVACVAGALC
jgi:hypothetical protein